MKNLPWKGIMIGCAVMTALVVARCITTAARSIYYGRSSWYWNVLADPWTYVGVVAAIAGIVAFVFFEINRKKATVLLPGVRKTVKAKR